MQDDQAIIEGVISLHHAETGREVGKWGAPRRSLRDGRESAKELVWCL